MTGTTNFNWTNNTGADFEVEANTTFAQIEASLSEELTVSVTSSNAATLSTANYRGYGVFIIDEDSGSPANAAITITVPNTQRGFFSVVNNTSYVVTVTISGQSKTAPTIAAGETGFLVTDGSNIQSGT